MISNFFFFLNHKFQSRCLFLLLPFDCYYNNPNESFMSWIRIPVANRTIQAIMKLLSQPIIQPSGIKIICSVSLHDPTTLSVGVCREQQTASWIQPPNASFLPALTLDHARQWAIREGSAENAVWVWLIFNFTRPRRKRGGKCKHHLSTNTGAHPGSFMEPRVD